MVEGVFKTDGYAVSRKFEPAKIAEFICQRQIVGDDLNGVADQLIARYRM